MGSWHLSMARTTLGSFLNSNSKSQPWGTRVLAALRDLLDFQGPVCLADGREAGRKGAQIGVTGRTRAPTPGCPEFPQGLIQADGSLGEKEDGMFPRRHWHLQFLRWKVWHILASVLEIQSVLLQAFAEHLLLLCSRQRIHRGALPW